jgi:hypothetical protein
MGVRGIAALLAVAAVQPAAAAPAETPRAGQPQSLVVAEWRSNRVLASGCPPAANLVCDNGLVEARVTIVDNLAGPQVPPFLTIRFVAHVLPWPRERAWLIVARGRPHRPWPALLVFSVGRADEVCVNEFQLEEFGGEIPPGGRIRDESRCYRYHGAP